MSQKKENLIWIDLEMTGLDVKKDRIIEIATVVTCKNLNVIAEGPELAVFQEDELLNSMDDWNTKQHNSSGLIKRVREDSVSELEAESQTLEFLANFVARKTSPICGNSVWQDRKFLYSYMPKLENYFHYRQLDVSSLKLLANYWSPSVKFKKDSNHRAKDDILQSIDELKFYRKQIMSI